MGLRDRIGKAWNAFTNKQTSDDISAYYAIGSGSNTRADIPLLTYGNGQNFVTVVNSRIALDVASKKIAHVVLDKNSRFTSEKDSGLNSCLSIEANLDQTGRELIRDATLVMLDKGAVAVVPVTTDKDPNTSDSYDIRSLRAGEIVEWFPDKVKVRLYNEMNMRKEDLVLSKRYVAIVQNPFYMVMNSSNSTAKRLANKLRLLDVADEKATAPGLDLIIKLPYSLKSAKRQDLAKQRIGEIENQLTNSSRGIAYIDATENVTQLNRSIDNNLLKNIEYYQKLYLSQMYMTEGILDGTADEKTQLSYLNNTIEPILSAFVDEFKRKFLTKTARSQGQSVMYFSDPFKLVPVSEIAEIADKFTRNEIMSSNEVRQVIGMIPSDDPKADELRNKNLSEPNTGSSPSETAEPYEIEE